MKILKNNLRALLYYFAFLLICNVFLFAMVVSSPVTGPFMILWPVRIASLIGMFIILFWLGSRLKLDAPKQADYFSGMIIVCIGIFLVVKSIWITSGSVFLMPSEEALYDQWGGANAFLLPSTIFSLFLDLPRLPWMMAVFSFVPSIVMGAGLRWGRSRLVV